MLHHYNFSKIMSHHLDWSLLKVAPPQQPTGVSPFILLQGNVHVMSAIAFMKGTPTSCWPRSFCFQARWRPDFIPCGLGLALLFPNYSFLSAARLQCHGPFAGVPPSMCFCDRRSPVIITCTSLESWTAVLASTWWDTLEPVPARLFTSSEVLPTALPCVYHTEALLLHCCPPYREFNAVTSQGAAMALPQRPVERGTLNPQMHHGSA
jgi:hypothetical protein